MGSKYNITSAVQEAEKRHSYRHRQREEDVKRCRERASRPQRQKVALGTYKPRNGKHRRHHREQKRLRPQARLQSRQRARALTALC